MCDGMLADAAIGTESGHRTAVAREIARTYTETPGQRGSYVSLEFFEIPKLRELARPLGKIGIAWYTFRSGRNWAKFGVTDTVVDFCYFAVLLSTVNHKTLVA